MALLNRGDNNGGENNQASRNILIVIGDIEDREAVGHCSDNQSAQQCTSQIRLTVFESGAAQPYGRNSIQQVILRSLRMRRAQSGSQHHGRDAAGNAAENIGPHNGGARIDAGHQRCLFVITHAIYVSSQLCLVEDNARHDQYNQHDDNRVRDHTAQSLSAKDLKVRREIGDGVAFGIGLIDASHHVTDSQRCNKVRNS